MRFRTFGSGARAACFSGASSDCADEFGFLPSLCRKRNLCSVATTACSHDMRERARNESLVAGKVACQRADSSEQFLLCPVVSSAGQPVADSMRIVADADESAEHRGGFGRPCFADGRFPLVVRACEKVGRSVQSPVRFIRGGFFDLSDQKPEQFAQGDGHAFRNVFFADLGLYALPPRCIPIVGRESGRDDAVSLFVLLQRKSVFFGERRQRSVPCFGLFGEAAEKQREHVVVIDLVVIRRGLTARCLRPAPAGIVRPRPTLRPKKGVRIRYVS